MCVSASHQPELLKVQPHTESGNNGDIVTLHTALTRNHTGMHTSTHTHEHTNAALCARGHENQFHPASSQL